MAELSAPTGVVAVGKLGIRLALFIRMIPTTCRLIMRIILGASLLLAFSPSGFANTNSAMDFIKSWQVHIQERIGKYREQLRQSITSTQTIKIDGEATAVEAATPFKELEVQLVLLSKSLNELYLESDFVDRLGYQIETQLANSGEDLRTFTERKLLELALQMTQGPREEVSLAVFCAFASVAIRELSEPSDDILPFLRSYAEFSTLTTPKPPSAFAEQRNYSNGVQSEKANPKSRDEAGDNVDDISSQNVSVLTMPLSPNENRMKDLTTLRRRSLIENPEFSE
jgi:hypothetical protein